MPAVRHQEREFVGMLEYRGEDEPLLLRNLIIGWRPIPLSSLVMCPNPTRLDLGLYVRLGTSARNMHNPG